MKFTLLASIGAVAAAQIDLDDASMDISLRFEAFVEQFQKQYTADEREAAFAAFVSNDAKVQDYNSQGLSYTLGHNEFSDLTSEEFNSKYIGSYLDNPNLDRSKNYDLTLSEPERVAAAPSSIDWTTKGAVTPIKNQGQCGSCWAFSTVMGIEGDLFVEKNELTSLSEQDLVSCDHNGDQGCNGGLMDNAFAWVEKNGLCTEKAYPYTSGSGTTGTCKTACKPYVKIKSFTDVKAKDESALKVAVAQQPVSVAIEADKAVFQLYKSGVLKASSCGTQLDHGVGIVGYGTYMDGTEYWKVKNSWGTTWGMDGYILMERGVNECGIAQQASFPTGAEHITSADDDTTSTSTSTKTLITERHVHTATDPDPPQPQQPKDFVIVVTNFCNTTATLSTQDRNLWEGTLVTPPPDTIASQLSHEFKYGFEVQADPTSERINGTVLYENPTVYIDFFSVPNEWGVMVSFEPSIPVVTTQADVGNLSVYNLIVGQGQSC